MGALTTRVGHAANPVVVGLAPARSLVTRLYKHDGRRVSKDSIPMCVRRQWPYGFDRHWPTQPELEGNDLRVLFSFILYHMNKLGFLDGMTKKPRVATDHPSFHSQYWKKFLKAAVAPWSEMTPQQKRDHVRAWLFKKFSMDRWALCMKPVSLARRKYRNEIEWHGVEIDDVELDALVGAVMRDYFEAGG